MAENTQSASAQQEEGSTEAVDIRADVERFLNGDMDVGKLADGEVSEADLNDEGGDSQYSPAEVKAMSQGWKPRTQYSGEPDDFIDANEFNRRGELFERINKDKAKIGTLEKAIKQLSEYNKQVREMAYNQAVDELKSQRVAAMKEQDVDLALSLEEKLDNLKSRKDEYIKAADVKLDEEEAEVEQPTNTVSPEQQAKNAQILTAWSAENKWYETDPDLKVVADAVGAKLYNEIGSSLPLDKFYQKVSDKVKELFPDKFQEAAPTNNRPRNQRVLGGRRTGGDTTGNEKPKYTAADLNDVQQMVMRNLLKTGAIKSEQQYIDDLVRIGGIE